MPGIVDTGLNITMRLDGFAILRTMFIAMLLVAPLRQAAANGMTTAAPDVAAMVETGPSESDAGDRSTEDVEMDSADEQSGDADDALHDSFCPPKIEFMNPLAPPPEFLAAQCAPGQSPRPPQQ